MSGETPRGGGPVERLPVSSFGLDLAAPGEKKRVHLVIDHLPDGSELTLPLLLARGSAPGKTLLAAGGVHGDEYEGPVAIQDVFEELDPAAMAGSFVGVPVVNGPALAGGTREGAWDHLNLARAFPGDPAGSPTQRIAHAFATYLLPAADLFVDLHSAGNGYAIKELAGYMIKEGEVGRIQREAAEAFGLDLMWGTPYLPGRTLSAAAERGIPAVYAEMRGEGRCLPDQAAKAALGLRRLLAYLGVIEFPLPLFKPRWVVEESEAEAGHLQVQHPSPTSGLFVPGVSVWSQVSRGDTLGYVRHPDGRRLARVEAKRSGRVLFLRTYPRVFSGDALAYILPADQGGLSR